MKKQKIIREVIDLIKGFFKPYGLQEEILEIPKDVQKMGLKIGVMNLGITLIALAFSFLLKITNMLIEQRMIILAIICFMLFRGQTIVREAFFLFETSENQKFDLIFKDEILFKGSQIIGRVSNKILKFDQSKNVFNVMSNEAVLNSVKNYLQNYWKQKIQHIFDIYEIISVIAMLIASIITNNAIPQLVFVPLLISFAIISFFSAAYISINRDRYYRKNREYDNEQALIINDLLRVPTIVKYDMDMRIGKFKESIIQSNYNVKKFHRKMNLSRLVTTILEALSQYGIIMLYLMKVNWVNITLASITEITATLLIVETALGYIGRIAETLNNHNERMTIIEKEEKDISLILKVYNQEIQKVSKPKIIEDIHINPFSIKYLEESENDKPFTLVSKKAIDINKGDVIILSGASGSGKSTFMRMITERIRIKKDIEIPATSRFMFYDETLMFGSLSIFDELFCCTKNPDLYKMEKILKNLYLWNEINANCIDIWKWMKQKKFKNTLSNGQKQRLILAKMLYWLDDQIDVIVLDECTSGLDDKSKNINSADAESILKYIIEFCNSSKQRTVIISTHQNIDGLKEELEENKVVKSLFFQKESNFNVVN